MTTIAYLRVSNIDQDIEKNKLEILKFANDRNLGRVEFVEEKISGKVPWQQRKLGDVINNLKNGDNLILNELSRLARSTLQILEILTLARQKGINVFAIKGNWKFDHSMQSKIIETMFALMSEIERDLISERTKEALKARKAQGIKLGRPKGRGKSKLDPFKEEIEALLKTAVPKTRVAKKYGVTTQNLYNWLRKNNIDVNFKQSSKPTNKKKPLQA